MQTTHSEKYFFFVKLTLIAIKLYSASSSDAYLQEFRDH